MPRDVGAGWDFDDVRDHYLRAALRRRSRRAPRVDHAERYLELSRAVSGEVMAEVFGEWRRAGVAVRRRAGPVAARPRARARAGALLDHRGAPKVAYHHLRRALAPVGRLDRPTRASAASTRTSRTTARSRLDARLRVALYRDQEQRVGEGEERLRLDPHAAHERSVEELIGHFADVSWAYRFGPPAQDVIVASLDRNGTPDGSSVLSQAFRFPGGRPASVELADRLGLSAQARPCGDGLYRLTVDTRRLAYGVRIHAPGFVPDDDAFSIEPGGSRQVDLRARTPDARFGGELTAINLAGRLPISPVAGS